MAFLRVMVLLWADMLAAYVMWIMQTYLTDVWKLGFTHAAGIINIANGLAKVLPLVFFFIVDSGLGNRWMLLLSSVSYVTGLGFLSMSTPPVLAKATGTCEAYMPQCIGQAQKALFFTALALIAVGISGHFVSLVALFANQFENGSNQNYNAEDDISQLQFQTVKAMLALVTRHKVIVFRACLVVLFPVIGLIALPYIKPWSLRFGIPAICSLVATIAFLLGWRECEDNHTGGLRFSDGAAIEEEQSTKKWRLCTVTEETKIITNMFPIWITCVICGVVTSTGSTYFVEQGNHMSFKVGKLKLPNSLLLVLYEIAKSRLTLIARHFRGPDKCEPRVGIAIATLFSVLCCIVAALVETRRIHVIRDHRLLDKPNETIPMTVFWLLPQYILLAGLDSFYENSVASFLNDQSPPSMKQYFVYLNPGLSGLGIMGSVLSVFVVGRVSETRGKQNWFLHTLNRSRLDYYYWSLAVLSAANFFWFLVAASRYRY